MEKNYFISSAAADRTITDAASYRKCSQNHQTEPSTRIEYFNSCVPPSSEICLENDEMFISTENLHTERTVYNAFCTNHLIEKRTVEERFREIKALQNHYVHLLRNLCKHSNDLNIRSLGDTDASLKRSMVDLREISNYCSVLTK